MTFGAGTSLLVAVLLCACQAQPYSPALAEMPVEPEQ